MNVYCKMYGEIVVGTVGAPALFPVIDFVDGRNVEELENVKRD